MGIEYRRDAYGLTERNLVGLWRSVGWVTGSIKYPNRLLGAVQNSDVLVVAWDGDVLVGVLAGIDDLFNVFINYLLVRPYYQGGGIGSIMLNMLLEDCGGERVFLLTQNARGFYKKYGFSCNAISMSNEKFEGRPKIAHGVAGFNLKDGVVGLKEDNLFCLWKSVFEVDTVGNLPACLLESVQHSDFVVSVWDEDRLIGIAAAMDDTFNAYISWLCVAPEYQDQGIGTVLMGRLLERYKDFRLYLLTQNALGFYGRFGFERDCIGMQKYLCS